MTADSARDGKDWQIQRKRVQKQIVAGRGVCELCSWPIRSDDHWSLSREAGKGVSPDSAYICRSTSPQGTFSVHKGIVDNSEVTAPSCTLLRSTVCGKDTSILVLPPSLEASMRKSCDRVR